MELAPQTQPLASKAHFLSCVNEKQVTRSPSSKHLLLQPREGTCLQHGA